MESKSKKYNLLIIGTLQRNITYNINNFRISFPLAEKACFSSPNRLMSARSNLRGKKQTWTSTDEII